MDPRESFPPPASLQHHQPQQLPPGMMTSFSSYSTQYHHLSNINKNSNLISPNSIQPFTFNSEYTRSSLYGGYDNDPEKKRRGRPRKYFLTPPPVNADGGGSGSGGGGTLIMDLSGMKQRGRPVGSGKKQQDAFGSPGFGFVPHVIIVEEGEDIVSKIMSFSEEGARIVCILSAYGAINNVTLLETETSDGTITYEGQFEILSLSGSFDHSDYEVDNCKSTGLSVSVASSNGRVLGGGVVGALVAASPVQVIVGSFIADEKKSNSSTEPSSMAPPNMLGFGPFGDDGEGPVHGTSPLSEEPSSESSDESDGSPVQLIPGSYNDATEHQQQQPPMENLPEYSNMGCPSSPVNMPPN